MCRGKVSDLPALFPCGKVFVYCWGEDAHAGELDRALQFLATANKIRSWLNPAAQGSLQTQAKPQLRNSSVANAAPTLLCSGAAIGVSWSSPQCAPSVTSRAERLFSCLLLLFSSSGTPPSTSREVDSEEMSFAPLFWHMCCSGNVTAQISGLPPGVRSFIGWLLLSSNISLEVSFGNDISYKDNSAWSANYTQTKSVVGASGVGSSLQQSLCLPSLESIPFP